MAMESSSAQTQRGKNRGGTEPTKKMKKLRSIKLSRLPSSKPSTRRAKSRSDHHPVESICNMASSRKPPSIKVSDKATSCLDARKEHIQASPLNFESSFDYNASYSSRSNSPPGHKPNRILTRAPSLKPAKALTRMSSLKLRRPLIKKKLNKSRSIKLRQSTRLSKRQSDQPRIDLSSNASTPHKPSPRSMSNMSPSYLKATGSSDLRKAYFRSSPLSSESSSSGMDQRRKNSNNSKPSSGSPCLKSARTLTRKTTMKPFRILTKMASLKPKRPLVRKCSEVSQTLDLSVNRATCSSTLKNSKFPHHVEPELGGSDSKVLSAMKVCTFTYCSLHGHCHAPMPPLKRFLSMKRRSLKTQKSIKLKSVPLLRAKHSGGIKKGIQENQMVSLGNTAIPETPSTSTVISPVTEESGMDFSIEIYAKRASEASDISWKEESVASNLEFGDNNSILTDDRSDFVDFCLPRLEDHGSFNKISLNPDKIVSTCPEDAHEEITSSLQASDLFGEPSGTSKSNSAVSSASVRDPLEGLTEVSSASVRDPLEGLTAASEEKNEDSEPDCTAGVVNETQLGKQNYNMMWRLIYQSVVPGIAAKVGTQQQHDGAVKEEQMGDANTLLRKNISGSCHGFSETDQDMENKDAGYQNIKLYQMEAIKLVEEAIDEIPLPETQDYSSDGKSITSDINSDQDLLERNNGEGVEQNISISMDSAKDSFREFDKIKAKTGTSLDPGETWLKPVKITAPEQEKTVTKVGSKSKQQMGRNWSNLKKIILLKRFIKALGKVRAFNPREPRYLPMKPDPEAENIHLRHQTMEERKSAEEWMLDYALRQVVGKLTPARKRRVELLVEAFETVIPPSEIGTFQRHNAAVSTHTNPVEACVGSKVQGEETGKENDYRNLAEVPLGETSDTEKCLVISPELKETSPECCFIETELDKPVAQPSDADWKEKAIVSSNTDNGEDNSILTDDHPNSVNFCLPEVEIPRLCDKLSQKPDDTVSTYHEEVPAAGKAFQEVHEEIISSLKPDFCDSDPVSNGENLYPDDLASVTGQSSARTKSSNPDDFEESTAINSVVSSDSICDLSLDQTAATKENNRDSKLDDKFLQRFPPPEDSEPNCNTPVGYRTQLDQQKYIMMWRVIYKHVVSGTAAKVGSQLHIDGVDEEEQVDDANRLHRINNSGSFQKLSETDEDMGMGNHNAGNQKIELSQFDAIKLVEEAIDEILLPEIQDQSSDNQSVNSDVITDQDLLDKSHGGVGELNISTSRDSTEDSFEEFDKMKVDNGIMSDPEETRLKDDKITTQEQEKTVPKVGRKSNQQLSRSWSNLKKIILLKRFTKALEKVRKFNPRKPRYLPLEPDSEAEKIDLRHQTAEQRKSAEEWMLDYAVQQVVAKLTPARKRRVELLVEAFETVIPLSEIEAHQKHNTAVSPHARPIQARD